MKRIFGLALLLFFYTLCYSQVQLVASNVGNNFSLVYPGNLGSPATIPAGLMITFKSTVSITGSATLNVNGSGAKPIKKQVTVDLTAGDILNGQFVTVIYDGTNFQLLSSVFSSNGTSWLVGGNTITGSNLLGTLNNSDLTLVSNSVPGIRISATSSTPGYVGIGTLTPTMPLHVSSKVPYFLGQSFFNGSAMFENTYLSNSSSIGIGMYAKSNANEYGVGAVIDGGQLGLYAISQVTGSGLGPRIGIQTKASGGLSGIGVDANSFGTNSSIGARMVGNSTVGDAKGIDVRGDTQDGRAYGVEATATSGTNLAYGGDFSASSTNSDSYGGNFSSNSANGASYGVKISSNSTIGATIGLDISSQTNSTGVAYGENIYSFSSNNDAYGSYITSTSNNGSYSYGQYIYNTNFNTAGIAFGSYLYNTGSGASTGLQITNYAGTGYSSVGIYASAFGGSANYSGYFASGDVFVNDRIGVGTSNPSERITVENANYGITHRDGTGIGSAIMSTYIGNFYTTSFIPGGSIGMQTDHPFFIYINNSGEKFYIGNSTQNYNVGVGTNDPKSKLSVYSTGANWDLSSTEGDFSVGSGNTYRFKVGVATGGGGAGDVYVGAHGGTNRMFLGTGSANFQTMAIANGRVGIGTPSPSTELEVNGFTKLGSNAPAIKNLFLTTTSPAAQGGSISVAHGLTDANILSVNVLVEYSPGFFVPNSYTRNAGYQFDFYFGGGVIYIYNSAANSVSILSKPVKIFITYQ